MYRKTYAGFDTIWGFRPSLGVLAHIPTVKGGILYLHTDNPCLITLIQLYRVNYLLGISLCPRALQTHFLDLWSLPPQIWASFTIPPFSEHRPCPSGYACWNTRYLPAYLCIPYTFTQFFIQSFWFLCLKYFSSLFLCLHYSGLVHYFLTWTITVLIGLIYILVLIESFFTAQPEWCFSKYKFNDIGLKHSVGFLLLLGSMGR